MAERVWTTRSLLFGIRRIHDVLYREFTNLNTVMGRVNIFLRKKIKKIKKEKGREKQKRIFLGFSNTGKSVAIN